MAACQESLYAEDVPRDLFAKAWYAFSLSELVNRGKSLAMLFAVIYERKGGFASFRCYIYTAS